ncbi:MAG: DUF4390 domain-containing protein [Nitrospirota bacterium]
MSRFLVLFLLIIFLLPALSEGQVIHGPDIRIINHDIIVSFSLTLEEKNILEIKQGIDKELRFYIDLFKVWKIWPDEFVLGKSYLRTLKSDPVKKENVATSNDGNLIIERRFRSIESMLDWTLSVKDLKLTNIKELDPGQYFVRISIESRARSFPPVIGYLFIFLSENEFKIRQDSGQFIIKGNR